ncbi:hypothetical protein I203_108123 [Kwoniella mangroviensis CBS 8507]|uniref:hypothetical protein n=1 Tax=Kwoniella mangroviensis CBS 8507 TaxID=1296122 RepID=UPI00080D393A|nr:uncharacterized protein I203_05017 [Kwoniella mangroviensis CBS 8507]OCF65995.1 hypothetical protein I203_05017 [Kwoniella mangroviensis CBS 8507]
MERQPSVLNKLRSRHTYDSIPNNGGDEWYIPYSPNSRPDLPFRQSGIGLSPISPTKPSTNYSMFSNVFSTTSNAIAGPSTSKPFPVRPATTTPLDTYDNNPSSGIARLLPSSRKQGALYKSPSYNSISDLNNKPERIPSSSSVPTGLQAPNILFSPLNRELRAGSSSNNPQQKSYPPSSFNRNPIQRSQPINGMTNHRQRAVSAPKPRKNNPYEYKAENKRWAVPTMCDMFLLPRPTLLPHEITPPTTPEDENEKRLSVGSMNSTSTTNNNEAVLEKGRFRDEEREEWANLVKRRGRSLSLGSTAPPPGAPIIGNARARSREKSIDGSSRRSRSHSLIRALTPSTSLRKRSASFGSRFTNPNPNSASSSNPLSRKSSVTRRESSRKNSGRNTSFLNLDGLGTTHTARPSHVTSKDHGHSSKQRFSAPRYSSDDYMYISHNNRKRSTSMPYSTNSALTRSDPLLANFATASVESRYPITAAIPSGRSLQFKQPSVADKGDKGGVVIISKGASRRTPFSAKYEREGTFRPPAPLNLSKPLPDIPQDDISPILPESGPFISLTDEIGVAISPDIVGVDREVIVIDNEDMSEPKTAPLPKTTDPLSPKTFTAKSRLSDGGSATARAFLAKQQQRARTKRAFQSPSKGPVVHRIIRDSTTASQTGHLSTSASTPTTASTSISSVLSPSSSTTSIKSDEPRRKTALEEAIGRSRASSVGMLEQQQAKYSPTRMALMENRPNTSESHKKKFGTTSVPGPPRVAVQSPTQKDQHQRFSSPDVSYSISPAALDYPISTVPSPRTKSGPSFLDVRPNIVHGESNVSKVTIYTDASEGWSRAGTSARSTPISDRKDRLSEANSEDSPGQTPDDRDFQGLFFRTPADRNGSFSNTPIPGQYAPSSTNHLSLPRAIPEGPVPVGLGYDMDPTPHSTIVLEDDQPRRPSDGSESTAEIATPNMSGQSQQPYMGYLDQLETNDNAMNTSRVQQRLMAPWNNRRPVTSDSPDLRSDDGDEEERDERSQDTHETAIPILSEGHEFPFPRSHDTIRNLAQAQAQAQEVGEEESATQRTPDGKRRPSRPHAPLSPGTFGIITTSTSTSSTSPSSASKHINFAPSSFQNYSLAPHRQDFTAGGLSPIPGSVRDSSTSPVLGHDHRNSAAVSFFDEFPTPPGDSHSH